MISDSFLLDYYQTNYTSCPPETYLNSNQFFVDFTNFLSPFSIVLGSYGILVILIATPKAMESVKWCLMHYHVITFLLELSVNNLSAPIYFLPSFAAYCNGLLVYIGVPFKVALYLIDGSLQALGVSIIMLFENRHSQVFTIKHKMTKKRTKLIFYTCNYILLLGSPLLYYFENLDQSLAKQAILKYAPCPERHFFDDETQVLTTKLDVYSAVGGFSMLYFVVLIQFYAIQSGYYLLRRTVMSESTRKLQRRFFIILLIQITVPLSFIFIPNIIYLTTKSEEQFVSTLSILFMSIHGLVSSTTIILIHRPYREFTYNQTIGRIFVLLGKNPAGQQVQPLPDSLTTL